MKYGELNGHSIGRILKETVRRATVVIRNERLVFEAQSKIGYSGTMDDVFTSADTKAQEVYLRAFRECFPDYGVIGEEDSLVINPSGDSELYFTVDPLDGTKAYIRRQSHGVGTMVSLVCGTDVLSAYIGDVNTEEVYGYRPDSNDVFRITKLDTIEKLNLENGSSIENSHALLRDPALKYSEYTRNLLSKFKSYEIIGSSIGIWMAQLWKGEVSAVFMKPGWETPWDSTPIIGISKKLGCVFLKPDTNNPKLWVEYEPKISKEKYKREHDTLVIHKSHLSELGF